MAGLQLKWLGYPEIILDASPVKLETRKAIALLALLSVEAKTFAREAIAALFWPEHPQQRALANLRRLVFSLNQSLPGQLITDRASITLTPDCWVDVTAFHARVEALPGLTLDALEEAIFYKASTCPIARLLTIGNISSANRCSAISARRLASWRRNMLLKVCPNRRSRWRCAVSISIRWMIVRKVR